MTLTLKHIKDATQAYLFQGDLKTIIRGVSIDSRAIKKGQLFIAIKGERFDGHNFICDVIQKGVRAVLISEDNKKNILKKILPLDHSKLAILVVKDTTQALGQIAGFYRRQYRIPVIAVTGSAGKTTTKEMIASVLSKRYNVLRNLKTENNHFGVPLTLLKLCPSHHMVVLELGTNHPGEIAYLSQIAKPTVAVFTNIGESHLEGLKTVRGVFEEKFQMLNNTSHRGTVIFNEDDPYLKSIYESHIPQKKIGYSVVEKTFYQAEDISVKNNQQLEFKVRGQRILLKTPAQHNVHNALAAIICGEMFKVSFRNIQKALKNFSFSDHRQAIEEHEGLWILDDTYNANPISFLSAIETLNSLRVKGKKVLVCADMLELGARSKILHQEMAKKIHQTDIDWVLTIGDEAREISQTLAKLNGHRVSTFSFSSLKILHQKLRDVCEPGDAVLVKGSRGMKMERTIEFLTEFCPMRQNSPVGPTD